MIADRYGIRLTIEQLAQLLDITPHTVYNLVALGEFPIPTYKEGKRRFASYDAVADYLDAKADEAAAKQKAVGKQEAAYAQNPPLPGASRIAQLRHAHYERLREAAELARSLAHSVVEWHEAAGSEKSVGLYDKAHALLATLRELLVEPT
jgi:hypothetical protein